MKELEELAAFKALSVHTLLCCAHMVNSFSFFFYFGGELLGTSRDIVCESIK